MKLTAILAALLALSLIPAATAADLAATCSSMSLNSLQDYIDLSGDQCSVDIVNYSHFTFSSYGTGTLLTASDIKLTAVPLPDGLSGGFSISTISGLPFSVGEGLTANYQIFWSFVIDSGPVSGAANLDMDPPFGDTSITETICPDSSFDGTICYNYPQTLTVTTIPSHLHDSKIFTQQVLNFAQVLTTITLNGVGITGGSGFDSETALETITDSSTPEPGTSILLLGGLAATGFASSRKRTQ